MGADGDRDGEGKRAGLSFWQKAKIVLIVALTLAVMLACAWLWSMGS